MAYKRQCPECGNIIRYSDKDKFMVCNECGFSKRNPHYKNKGLPVILIVVISLVLGLALAVGGFFLIPFDVDKTKAAAITSTALSNMENYHSNAYTIKVEYASSTIIGETEKAVLSYKDDGDMYARLETFSKDRRGISSKVETYTYVDKKEMMLYLYVNSADSIEAYKEKIDDSEYNQLFLTMKNQVFSSFDFEDINIEPQMVSSAKRQGLDTHVTLDSGSQQMNITVYFNGYIKKIEMPGLKIEASLRFKKFRFDKSIFKQGDLEV